MVVLTIPVVYCICMLYKWWTDIYEEDKEDRAGRRRRKKRRRRGGRGGGGEEEVRKRKTTTRMTKMMTVSVIQSTKLQIAFILGSWLGLHFLLKVIPQILINVLLTVTFQLKNILVRTVSTIPVAYCIPMLVTLFGYLEIENITSWGWVGPSSAIVGAVGGGLRMLIRLKLALFNYRFFSRLIDCR